MQLKFLNSLVFILIEVTLLPGLLKNRSETSIHLLIPLVLLLPIWSLFSLSEAGQESFLSGSLRRKDKKLCHLFTPRQPKISEGQVVAILGMTLLWVSASHSPLHHCVGSTNMATKQKTWHSPILLCSCISLNGWRRQNLHAGCAALFLLPLWFGGGKENMRQDQRRRTSKDCSGSHMAESNSP